MLSVVGKAGPAGQLCCRSCTALLFARPRCSPRNGLLEFVLAIPSGAPPLWGRQAILTLVSRCALSSVTTLPACTYAMSGICHIQVMHAPLTVFCDWMTFALHRRSPGHGRAVYRKLNLTSIRRRNMADFIFEVDLGTVKCQDS